MKNFEQKIYSCCAGQAITPARVHRLPAYDYCRSTRRWKPGPCRFRLTPTLEVPLSLSLALPLLLPFSKQHNIVYIHLCVCVLLLR